MVVLLVMYTHHLLIQNLTICPELGTWMRHHSGWTCRGDTTAERQEARSVPVRTTGHDKARFAVVLAAITNHKKLKPFVVPKGVCVVTELNRVPASSFIGLNCNG